jgi:membrane-associated protein
MNESQAVANVFQVFVDQYASYGYSVLFLGVLLENAGLPVPGETAVLVAGYLASPEGGQSLHLLPIMVLAASAAIVGDNCGYWVGRRLARPRLASGRGWFLLTPQRFRLAEDYFARYGSGTVFVARFVTGLRVLAAPAAGAAGMPWLRFVCANALGAVAWAIIVAMLGYFFGRSWELLEHGLGWGAWAVLAVVAIVFLVRRRRAR